MASAVVVNPSIACCTEDDAVLASAYQSENNVSKTGLTPNLLAAAREAAKEFKKVELDADPDAQLECLFNTVRVVSNALQEDVDNEEGDFKEPSVESFVPVISAVLVEAEMSNVLSHLTFLRTSCNVRPGSEDELVLAIFENAAFLLISTIPTEVEKGTESSDTHPALVDEAGGVEEAETPETPIQESAKFLEPPGTPKEKVDMLKLAFDLEPCPLLRELAAGLVVGVAAGGQKKGARKDSFVGLDAVRWLLNQQIIPVETRKQAVQLGQVLSSWNVFRHCANQHYFQDDRSLYHFSSPPEMWMQPPPLDDGLLNVSLPWPESIPPRHPCVVAASLLRECLDVVDPWLIKGRLTVDNAVQLRRVAAYRAFCVRTAELQRVALVDLSHNERAAFLLNLHNLMAVHSCIALNTPTNPLGRISFFSRYVYRVGSLGSLSVMLVEHGLVRRAMSSPKAFLGRLLLPKFKDVRGIKAVALATPEPLVTFALACTAKSAPTIMIYAPDKLHKQLEYATKVYLRKNMKVMKADNTLYLPKVLDWWSSDFAKDKSGLVTWACSLDKAVDKSIDALKRRHQGKEPSVKFQSFEWELGHIL